MWLTHLKNLFNSSNMFDIYHITANLLSVSRVALMPFYAYCYLNNAYIICVYITAVALVTDMLDGYVARKSTQKSIHGGWVDPVCDAVTMLTITALFYIDSLIPDLFIAWIICRYIVFVYIALKLKSTRLQSSMLNKVSIGAFAIYGYSILLGLIHPIWQQLTTPALLATIILQAASMYRPIKLIFNQNMRVCKK